MPNFDDLTFLPCTLSRVPLEGYRERCETKTVLGTRFAEKPVELQTPITRLRHELRRAVAQRQGRRSARRHARRHVDHHRRRRHAPPERAASEQLVYQICPSHYGNDAAPHGAAPTRSRSSIGQGAKPGTGGVLLGAKVSDEVARMRDLPLGVDQRSPVRHPDFIGPADLRLKIEQIREATDRPGAGLRQDRRRPRLRRRASWRPRPAPT